MAVVSVASFDILQLSYGSTTIITLVTVETLVL